MPRRKKIEGYDHPTEHTKLYDIPALELAKSIIDRDPISHIHLTILAGKVGINEFKLKIEFRELFQTTPYQYRLRLCLEKAKDLLKSTDDCIHEIASCVGFDTYNGFSTAFKKPFINARQNIVTVCNKIAQYFLKILYPFLNLI